MHEVALRGRIEEEWVKFHAKYIYIWEDKYNFIPMRKPILTPNLATSLDYITWLGVHASMESSSAQTPHEALMGCTTSRSVFFTPPPSSAPYGTPMSTKTLTYPPSPKVPTFYPQLGYATQ
ncbi:hypothetical protein PVK06_012735 [Gossypium arboreum]|uniref:Uncharacterized protein n=1 Tax=Gossypium arboreum TaxID=29729 RepID=A0ABR0QD42_GOSAR|nr:hypothetical protein PVK06_012735 [Gossypium arboreum]